MADENTSNQTEGSSTEEGQAAPAPKKKKMLLLISVAVAVVGVGVAVGVVFFMGGESHEEDAATGEHAAPAVVVKEVPEFNLSLLTDDPGAQHFVKMKTSVELTKITDVAAVDAAMPKLQDDWGSFLRQMRMADLQGSANLQRLKEGLLRRANQSLAPVEVKAVYIRELLIQ